MIFHKNNVGREVIVNGKTDYILRIAASGEWFRLKSEENNSIAREYWPGDIQYSRLLTISFNGGKFHDVALCREDYEAPQEETVLPKEDEAEKGFKPPEVEPEAPEKIHPGSVDDAGNVLVPPEAPEPVDPAV